MALTKKEWDKTLTATKNMAAMLAEHNDHYVLIVRTPKDGLQWQYSDSPFALGACERLRLAIIERDKPPTQVEIV